jgi:integrase
MLCLSSIFLNSSCAPLKTWPTLNLLLLFRTGLREGEAIALQAGDMDLRSCYVLVQRNFTAGRLEESTKTDESRKVHLTKDLVEVLREHMAMTGATGWKWTGS